MKSSVLSGLVACLAPLCCMPGAQAWQDGDLKVEAWLPYKRMGFVYEDQGRSPHFSQDEVEHHIQASLTAWSACGLHLVYLGQSWPEVASGEGVVVIRWSQKEEAAGWARLKVVKGAIRGASIELASVATTAYSRGLKNYMLAAIAHEIGHAIGMRHGTYCDGVMGTCGYTWSTLPSSYDIWSCRAHYVRGEKQGFRSSSNPR